MCARLQVKGYPTVLYFRDGKKVEDYNSARTQEAVVEWLNHKDRMNGAIETATPVEAGSQDAAEEEEEAAANDKEL